MFWSSFIPCATCGEAIQREQTGSHVCDPERRVEFQMAAAQHRIDAVDSELEKYLATNAGRFEAWLAARDVRDGRGSRPSA